MKIFHRDEDYSRITSSNYSNEKNKNNNFILIFKILIAYIILNFVYLSIPEYYFEYLNSIIALPIVTNKHVLDKSSNTQPYVSGPLLYFNSQFVYEKHLKTIENNLKLQRHSSHILMTTQQIQIMKFT